MSASRGVLTSSVEVVCGVGLIVAGVVVQVQGSRTPTNTTLLVTGAVLVALGGVLISWIAARALGEKQAEEAAEVARNEIDEKLDSLSRVLGQAAGQISQAVEQVDLQQIPASTGFALISQATRMVYGQVNEIAVLRGSEFDSAYLLDTATTLDDLARQLAGPGNSRTSNRIEEVRRQLQDVKANLASGKKAAERSYPEATVGCPYCGARNEVRLGSLPGDTAAGSCAVCGESFNAHRAASGSAFSRPRGVAGAISAPDGTAKAAPARRWEFSCPKCEREMSAPSDGQGARLMICTSCMAALDVDPDERGVKQRGAFELRTDVQFRANGTRPKWNCPSCGRVVKAALITDRGHLGICSEDRIALMVEYGAYESWRNSRRAHSSPEGAPLS